MIRATVVALALSAVVVASHPAAAQPPGDGSGFGPPGGRPMFLEHLFRPELIMRNQAALALTAEQRAAIAAAMRETQARLGPLQWDLDAKSEAIGKQVDAPKVDVDAALASAAQVIDLEGQVKKEHLRLLLTIKNLLTPEQQAKLRQLRAERWGAERHERERGPGPGERAKRGGPPPGGPPPGGPGDGPPPPRLPPDHGEGHGAGPPPLP